MSFLDLFVAFVIQYFYYIPKAFRKVCKQEIGI